jgi:hypothetical protein
MANGSYEVTEWIDNGLGAIGDKFWVKPEEISYEIMKDQLDDLENYFEFIFDEDGLHIVPKNIDLVQVDADRDDLKKIVMSYPDNKHKTVTVYIGDTKITDEHEICETPPTPPTLGEKLKNIITGEEDV